MSSCRCKALFRVVSVILIATFIAFDISWAYPSYSSENSTLATQGILQQNMMTTQGAGRQDVIFSDIKLLTSVRSIGKILLDQRLHIKYLESTLTQELGKVLIDGLDLSKVMLKDGVVLIPFVRNNKRYVIQVALKDMPEAGALKGYDLPALKGDSDRYVAKILPESEQSIGAKSFPAKDVQVQALKQKEANAAAIISGYVFLEAGGTFINIAVEYNKIGMMDECARLLARAKYNIDKYLGCASPMNVYTRTPFYVKLAVAYAELLGDYAKAEELMKLAENEITDDGDYSIDEQKDLIAGAKTDIAILRAKRSGAKSFLAGDDLSTEITRLIGALEDKEWNVRRNAVITLGKIGPEARAAIPALMKVLEGKERAFLRGHPDPLAYHDYDVRYDAAEALCEIGLDAEKDTPLLIEFLGYTREWTENPTSDPAINDPGEVEYHSDRIVQMAAIRNLGKIGPAAKTAIPQLRKLLEDDSDVVRSAAENAIRRIESAFGAKSFPAGNDIFALDTKTLKNVARNFRTDIQARGNKALSSLSDIVTEIGIPTGKEKGNYLYIDLGGTNLRVGLVELLGGRKLEKKKKKNGKDDELAVTVPLKVIKGGGKTLFEFIARKIKSYVKAHKLSGELKVGFTFSFAMKKQGVDKGIITEACNSKGYNFNDVINGEVVTLLNKALSAIKLTNVKVVALVNDTEGVRDTGAYLNEKTIAGGVFGTGHNTAIRNKKGNSLNLESGAFNKLAAYTEDLEVTGLDKELDELYPVSAGVHPLEKRISGKYVGPLFGLKLEREIIGNRLFAGHKTGLPAIFKDHKYDEPDYKGLESKYMTEIEECWLSGDMNKIKDYIKQTFGVQNPTDYDAQRVRDIAHDIMLRSAQLGAATFAGIVMEREQTETPVGEYAYAIDGSLLKYPGYMGLMKDALADIFGKEYAAKLEVFEAKDGAGIGAAITAMIVSTQAEAALRQTIAGRYDRGMAVKTRNGKVIQDGFVKAFEDAKINIAPLSADAAAYLRGISLDEFKSIIRSARVSANLAKNAKKGLALTVVAGMPFGENNGHIGEFTKLVETIRRRIREIAGNQVEFNQEEGISALHMTIQAITRTKNFTDGDLNSMRKALDDVRKTVKNIDEKIDKKEKDSNLAGKFAKIAGENKPFEVKLKDLNYYYKDGEISFTLEPASEFTEEVKDGKTVKTLKIKKAFALVETESKGEGLHISLGRVTAPLTDTQIAEINNLFNELQIAEMKSFEVDNLKVVMYGHRSLTDVRAQQVLKLGVPGQKWGASSLSSITAGQIEDMRCKTIEDGSMSFKAAIFDLDGVVTKTDVMHFKAWKGAFDWYLKEQRQQLESAGVDTGAYQEVFREFTQEDYDNYVDGLPRYKGVKYFLESRGFEIKTPQYEPLLKKLGDDLQEIINEGSKKGRQERSQEKIAKIEKQIAAITGLKNMGRKASLEIEWGVGDKEPADNLTVSGIGSKKNAAIKEDLNKNGVDSYEDIIKLIEELRGRGVRIAVASSSQNCVKALEVARYSGKTGIAGIFGTIVDGFVSPELGLTGKPNPDIFVKAAELMGVEPKDAIVFEDANEGVLAGRNGKFGMVVGVARRHDKIADLKDNGANEVFEDMGKTNADGLSKKFEELNPDSGTKSFPAAKEAVQARMAAPSIFDLLEHNVNSERRAVVNTANNLLASLRAKDSHHPEAVVSGIDVSRATAEVKSRIAEAISAVGSLQGGRVVVENFKIAADLKKRIDQLEAEGVVASIVTLARKAAFDKQKLIIGLDTDWIPGYDEQGSLQHQSMNPLVREIESIPEILRSMGLDNVVLVHSNSKELASSIMQEADRSNTKLSNVVILASKSIVESESFASLRSTPTETKAFIAAIDPAELMKFFKENKDPSKHLDIKILEMLSVALDIAAGKEPPNIPMVISYNKSLRIIMLLPKAEPKNYEEINRNYYARKMALAAA